MTITPFIVSKVTDIDPDFFVGVVATLVVDPTADPPVVEGHCVLHTAIEEQMKSLQVGAKVCIIIGGVPPK